MYLRRRAPRPPLRRSRHWSLYFLIISFLAFLVCTSLYLRTIATQIAISDAGDLISLRINQAIAAIMSEEDFDGDSFVTLEKGDNGEIAAISSPASTGRWPPR